VSSDLEQQSSERGRAGDGAPNTNAPLEQRVLDRTVELERVNQALVRDAVRFEIAADAARLGFWTFEVENGELHWDKRMFGLYGLAPLAEGLPFSSWLARLHSEDRERCKQEVTDALSGPRSYDTEFRIIHASGEILYLRAAGRTTRDTDGRIIRMFGVSFDISESKRADERFRLAIDAAPTGMLLMNVGGSMVMVNAAIERLFGYPRAELIGRQVEMLVPERFRTSHPKFRAGFFDSPAVRAMGAGRELYGLRKDGSEMPVEIGLNPLHTSQGEFVLSSIVDLSQRQEMDRLRADFVSTVSHELRTPLTSISGSLGLLQSGALGALPENAAEMVRIAHKNCGRLVRIINDILDFGKLEAGQLVLQIASVPLAHILRQAVEANTGYAAKCEVRLRLEADSADDCVAVDPDRLMQVLTNLLSNAAKFSPAGAEVVVRMLSGETAMRVEVEDSGPGIPEAFRSRVFEKFAQADSSGTRGFEGTGLGLSIARKLIEAMGGTIGFSTRLGQGTVFTLSLPRIDSSEHARPPILLSEAAARQVLNISPVNPTPGMGTGTRLPKLLYVEDDEDLVSVIRATMSGRVDIVAAQDLRDAERMLREHKFDLVILEQSLPDGSGINLVDRIPGLVGHHVPIVLLASEIPAHVHEKVDAVLVKSQASPAQVAATILVHLPTARL